MTNWTKAKVIKIIKWSSTLFSIILNAKISHFTAGQFAKLSVILNNNIRLQRAYSYVNSPNNKNLEFYITLIPTGKLSTYLYNLKINTYIMISKESYGFFTLKEIPISENLWMFATGTAIGPYLSILQEKSNILNKFNKVILIHAVRYVSDLSYLPLMKQLYHSYHGKLYIQTIVSREKHTYSLQGRIPDLLKNKAIETQVGLTINSSNSHIMLCGNPNMVKDTQKFLKEEKNMRKNLKKKPGHITTENYW